MRYAPVSIAVIESVFQEEPGGILDILVPFIVNLAYEKQISDFSKPGLVTFAEIFESEYGLRIPVEVLTTVLQKAEQKNFFTRQNHKASYTLNKEKIEALQFSEIFEEQTKRWHRVISNFRAYAAAFNTSLSEKQAESAFINFVSEYDGEILLASNSSSVLEFLPASDNHRYLVNRFVAHEGQVKSADFDFIVEMAMGHALASTILNWEMIEAPECLDGLNIYVDTPLLFELFGIADDSCTAAFKELINLLKGQGARLFVFNHNMDEFSEILDNAKCWIGNVQYDPSIASRTARFIVDNRWSVADVDFVLRSVDNILNEYGINRRSTNYAARLDEYQIDEEALKRYIVERYGQNPRFDYREKEKTIIRDIQSISTIHRLRKDHRSVRLGDANSIFMTNNRSLIAVSKRFEREELNFPNNAIPICLSDTLIGTVAWIESPTIGKRFSVKRIISHSLSAVQPCQELIKRFCAELEKRLEQGGISSEEYTALVADPLAREILAEATHNIPQRYQADSTEEIIEAYKESAVAEERKNTEAERSKKEKYAIENVSYRANVAKVAKVISRFIAAVLFLSLAFLVVLILQRPNVLLLTLGTLLFGGSVFAITKKCADLIERWLNSALLGFGKNNR